MRRAGTGRFGLRREVRPFIAVIRAPRGHLVAAEYADPGPDRAVDATALLLDQRLVAAERLSLVILQGEDLGRVEGADRGVWVGVVRSPEHLGDRQIPQRRHEEDLRLRLLTRGLEVRVLLSLGRGAAVMKDLRHHLGRLHVGYERQRVPPPGRSLTDDVLDVSVKGDAPPGAGSSARSTPVALVGGGKQKPAASRSLRKVTRACCARGFRGCRRWFGRR